MKVLLDTNIVIHRESFKVSHLYVGQFFNWLNRLKADQYLHQISIDEISTHHNKETIRSMGIKLEEYEVIKSLAPLDPRIDEVMKKEDVSQNDRNDSLLLNELAAGRVDYFITEDRKIHSKARALDISDRVYTMASFVEKLAADYPEMPNYKVLSIRKMTFGEIDLSDDFFDSFRRDYPGFDAWFTKKFNETAYVTFYENRVVGFLYLKVETTGEPYADICPIFRPKKRLKIGTFKVAINGYRIGERFLKIVFDNARIQRVDEIYVTIFETTPEQVRLIELLEEWGFILHGHKDTANGREKVFVRDFSKLANRTNPKLTFPNLSKQARVFIVPIYPEYHTELLPDSILNTESPANFVEHQPHRNALGKVYISHSYERNLAPGDVILFYRTGGFHKSVVSTIGIVEKVHDPILSFDELVGICYKKTFFTRDGLAAFWNRYTGNKPFVVEFLYTYSLPKRPNLEALIELGVIAGISSAPRGFQQISWEKFLNVIKASKSDESFIVD